MNQETLFNQIEKATYDLNVIWSTLEAVYDALQMEDCVAETYRGAIRGAADQAFHTKNCMAQLVIDINQNDK